MICIPNVYSYSKLNAFHQCPYSWKLTYLDRSPQVENAFSQYGSFCHKLMERYLRHELSLDILADLYDWEFDADVTVPFPPNDWVDLHKSYYENGLAFFQNWDGFADYEILAVEQRFKIPIDDFYLQGVIDLVVKDKDGSLVCIDHKSHKKYTKAELKTAQRQPYLYSLYCEKEYGKYPDYLMFHTFRNQDKPLVKIPFKHEDLEEAVRWAKNTVAQIEAASEWPKRPQEFFCTSLCGHRETCDYGHPDDMLPF